MKSLSWTAWPVGIVLLASLFAGCIETRRPLRYIGDERLQYYKDTATSIDYPQVYHETDDEVLFGGEPMRIRHLQDADIRNMTLVEAVHLALTNNKVFRTSAEFLSPANRLLTSPNAINNSVYDPAIQETEVFNGIGVSGSRRGLEDALSDFDARFTTNMTWQQNEQISNNLFSTQGLLPGSTFQQENRVLNSRLEKQLGNSGILSLVHNWNFTANNAPAATRLFGSFYDGLIQAEYRQPLLAGAGTEFTRIAGPIGRQQGNVNGVNRGVLIARIGQDISLADFELQVRNLVRDVEDLYWDLSLAYRSYHSEVVSRNSAERIWKNVEARLNFQGTAEAEEAQALESYFDAKARANDALAELYSVEGRLRRLLGLPVSDGQVIRPADEPVRAEFVPDWNLSLAESLTRRAELRRQKWQIKSLELQLKAARSLLKPRLDFVTNYRVNGFGHRLFGESDRDGVTTQGVRSAYETITQGNQTGWDIGFEFSMPFGFRQAHAQVRNIEMRLVKARSALSAQEHEISHELAAAFRDLDRFYETSQNYYNRRKAAARRVAALEVNVERKPELIDPLLRAYVSLAQAEVSYYRSLLQYNKSISDLHLRKGSLLERNSVFLSEGVWDGEAYQEAFRRALARSHAFDQERLYTEPGEFVLGYMDDYPHEEQENQQEQQKIPDMPQLPPEPPEPQKDPLNSEPLKMAPNTGDESLPWLGGSSKQRPVDSGIQPVNAIEEPNAEVRNTFEFKPAETPHTEEIENPAVEFNGENTFAEQRWMESASQKPQATRDGSRRRHVEILEPIKSPPITREPNPAWNDSFNSTQWWKDRDRANSRDVKTPSTPATPPFGSAFSFGPGSEGTSTGPINSGAKRPHGETADGWPGLEALRSPGDYRTGTSLRSSPGHPRRSQSTLPQLPPAKPQVKSEQLKYWSPPEKTAGKDAIVSPKPNGKKPRASRNGNSWTPFDLNAWAPADGNDSKPAEHDEGWSEDRSWKLAE